MSKQEFPVLVFDNASIYQEHLDSLNQGSWLLDPIFDFLFSYIQAQKNENKDGKVQQEKICLVSQSTSYLMMNIDSATDFNSFFDGLELKSKQIICLPVSNSTDPTQVGGSHFSLLVYSQDAKILGDLSNDNSNGPIFLHFDSSGNQNQSFAKKLCQKLSIHILGSYDKKIFSNAISPQQTNSYDCGVYVMAIVQFLFDVLTGRIDGECTRSALFTAVTPQKVTKFRKEIKNLIIELAKNYHFQ
ncbi:MAG: putative Sentrin-specific protease 8 [Streblomastix strix]|uniref:Putative Sentrin-specific protease 8 n=1 Tax=Streblomastix strix TaxID=222440 RepID=A0A5J4TNF4_9EUKA|nr:MAG: putative Sentrin-specific protease 8 [Streblomastix strix]